MAAVSLDFLGVPGGPSFVTFEFVKGGVAERLAPLLMRTWLLFFGMCQAFACSLWLHKPVHMTTPLAA